MKIKILSQKSRFGVGGKGYLFEAEKEDGRRIEFRSEFLFKDEWNIVIDLATNSDGDKFFDYIGKGGFVVLEPKGVTEIPITKKQIDAARSPNPRWWHHNLPWWFLILFQKRIIRHEWAETESFYTRNYFSEFDQSKMVLRSNK